MTAKIWTLAAMLALVTACQDRDRQVPTAGERADERVEAGAERTAERSGSAAREAVRETEEAARAAGNAIEEGARELAGKVRNVTDDVLELDSGEVRLGEETEFYRGEQRIERNEIRPGDEVRAAFGEGGEATRVEVE